MSKQALLAFVAGTAVALAACASSVDKRGGLGDNEGVRWADGAPDFSPARNVLLIPVNKTETGQPSEFNSDDNCFYDNATELKRFYEAAGARTTVLPVNTPEVLLLALDAMIKQHKAFDRIIFLAHGGWDGPMFFHAKQIGEDWPDVQLGEREGSQHREYYHQKAFLEYGEKLSSVLLPSGWIWVGSCNSATEGNSLFGATRYTDAMACATDRMTYGQATKTACWDVLDRVKKLENGIKTLALWRSNPKNLPSEMVCLGEQPEYPPLMPPPDLMPAPGPDAGGPTSGSDGGSPEPEPEPKPEPEPEPEPEGH